MAKVTLNDISDVLGFNQKDSPTDFHCYGTIVSVDNENGTYEVSINRDENITVEATKFAGAARGDTVMVTVMPNGYATITGRVGGDKDALDAKELIETSNQYFWHKETGIDNGTHITEIPREDFESSPGTTGNLLATSDGIVVRSGLVPVSSFTRDSIEMRNSREEDILKIYKTTHTYGQVVRKSLSRSEQKINVDTELSDIYANSGFTLYFKYPASATIVGPGTKISFVYGTSSTLTFSTTNYDFKFVYDASTGFINSYVMGLHDYTAATVRYTYALYESTTIGAPTYSFGIHNNIELPDIVQEYDEDTDRGNFSTIIGQELLAFDDCSLTIGKYNQNSSRSKNKAFVIGNGTSPGARNDALTATWNGVLNTYGETGTEIGYHAYNDTNDSEVFCGFGTGGTAHGVYSRTLGRWLIYSNGTDVFLNSINTKNLTMVYTQNKSVGSIAAGSRSEGTIAITSRTNYTPIGIVGYELSGTGAGSCFMAKLRVVGTNVEYYIRNTGTSAASVSLTVDILYKATI